MQRSTHTKCANHVVLAIGTTELRNAQNGRQNARRMIKSWKDCGKRRTNAELKTDSLQVPFHFLFPTILLIHTSPKPLSDDQDELRTWELSIIDEQVPLPPSHQASARGNVPMPMGELDERYSRQVPPEVPLPARMCTVSHCHKILPGFYRYKRCETHRIQNRWHSKLKRGREKIEKGFMLPDGTIIVPPGPIIKPKSNAEPKEKKPRKKRQIKGKEGETAEAGSGPSTLEENVEGGEERTTEQSTNNDKVRLPRCHRLILIIIYVAGPKTFQVFVDMQRG